MQYTAREISTVLNGTIEGNENAIVTKLSKIEEADKESLVFISNSKYECFANSVTAGALLINKTLQVSNPNIGAVIRVDDPYSSLGMLLAIVNNNEEQKSGLETQTFIGKGTTYGDSFYLGAFSYLGDNVRIGNNVKIYPNCFIGDNVTIGDNSTLYAGVKIYRDCVLGNDVIIQAGAVIGADGFGFAPQKDGTYQKIQHIGNVCIGNNVEIGANTCIDRAVMGSTHIKNGVKLDNLIHIAHNVEIGENTVIAAQVGVSGSTKLGKQVMIGGQAGIIGHITIADGVKINAQSGVSKAITKQAKSLTGSPAVDFMEHYRNLAQTKKIPDLLARIEQLEKKLNEKG
jgi:UDP-3-O-[3-hydroxymyristoyl] glucosamine N-acyltransferase